MTSNSGVYAITNTENGKTYIGSTIDFERRWCEHRDGLQKGVHGNSHLQFSWSKYGEGAFKFMICEYVKDKEQLIDHEQYWLDLHRMYVDVYNIALIIDRSTFSNETKRKMSKSQMGNQHALGHRHSKETRQKISKIHKGKTTLKETKRKISKAMKGNQNALGSKRSKEHIYRINEAWRGRKHTKEAKCRISAGVKAYWARVREESGE